jgi:hypothetical protein
MIKGRHYFINFIDIKMAVFWVVVQLSLVVYQRSRSRGLLIALMMEAANISETLVNFYHTTQHTEAVFKRSLFNGSISAEKLLYRSEKQC